MRGLRDNDLTPGCLKSAQNHSEWPYSNTLTLVSVVNGLSCLQGIVVPPPGEVNHNCLCVGWYNLYNIQQELEHNILHRIYKK